MPLQNIFWLVLHCAIVLRTIFAWLVRAHERVGISMQVTLRMDAVHHTVKSKLFLGFHNKITGWLDFKANNEPKHPSVFSNLRQTKPFLHDLDWGKKVAFVSVCSLVFKPSGQSCFGDGLSALLTWETLHIHAWLPLLTGDSTSADGSWGHVDGETASHLWRKERLHSKTDKTNEAQLNRLRGSQAFIAKVLRKKCFSETKL